MSALKVYLEYFVRNAQPNLNRLAYRSNMRERTELISRAENFATNAPKEALALAVEALILESTWRSIQYGRMLRRRIK